MCAADAHSILWQWRYCCSSSGCNARSLHWHFGASKGRCALCHPAAAAAPSAVAWAGLSTAARLAAAGGRPRSYVFGMLPFLRSLTFLQYFYARGRRLLAPEPEHRPLHTQAAALVDATLRSCPPAWLLPDERGKPLKYPVPRAIEFEAYYCTHRPPATKPAPAKMSNKKPGASRVRRDASPARGPSPHSSPVISNRFAQLQLGDGVE